MKLHSIHPNHVLACLGMLAIPAALFAAGNPMPFWGADPEPVQGPDGRMYIFPTNSGPDGAAVEDWHVYSSADLLEWVDHGQIIHVDDVKWADAKAWAPCATYRNGRFYFYYYFFEGDAKASVGVTSSPDAEHWTDHTPEAPLVTGLHDPAVYVDDDGQAYLFNSRKYIRLNDDMVSTEGEFVNFEYTDTPALPNPYRTDEEAAFVFQREGKYYMTQSPKHDPSTHWSVDRSEDVVYYMADSFTGPWEYKGIIMDAVYRQSRHASGYPFYGTYMLWYHILEDDLIPQRRPAAEYLHFNDDGTIRKVALTKEGVRHPPAE